MGLFKGDRKPRAPAVMTVSAEDLAQIGSMAYGGTSPHSPGPSALTHGELDRYVIAVMKAGRYPEIRSPKWATEVG
jgi:hypothetical protein